MNKKIKTKNIVACILSIILGGFFCSEVKNPMSTIIWITALIILIIILIQEEE